MACAGFYRRAAGTAIADIAVAPRLLFDSRGNRMMRWLIVATLCALVPTLAQAQGVPRSAPQQSSEPNYGTAPDQSTGPAGQEIRPGSPAGDAPSASAGRLATDPVERRIL